MTDNVIDLAERTAVDVKEILNLLKGDDYHEGLIYRVNTISTEIEAIKEDRRSSHVSRSTLTGVAWMGLVLVPVLTFVDRMILISDIRAGLNLYGYWAVAASMGAGLMAKTMLIFVVLIFSLRWMGWGRG